MKFKEINNLSDLKKFSKENEENFSLEITGCLVTRANGYADFNILVKIGDFSDTITTNGNSLCIAYHMAKARKWNWTNCYDARLDSTLQSKIDNCLTKKLKEYKKSQDFRDAHEEFIITQMTGIIESEFTSRSRQLNKFGYTSEQMENLFTKIIRRVNIKRLLE